MMEVDVKSSENESSPEKRTRLGTCEVCARAESKYCCPKCEVKTCCLDCLKIHKKELACDGIRDRTKYIPLKNMSAMDMLSDYTFLEECTRYVNDRKSDKIKHYTRYKKRLPVAQFRMRGVARQHGITLRYLLANFTRHKVNTTRLDVKTNTIQWRVEWVFAGTGDGGGGLKFVDEQCSELSTVGALLDKYFDPQSDNVPMKRQLEFYQARGMGNVRILLKAEGIKRCNNRFYELDGRKTLRDNLRGKTIVEFPVVYLVFPDAISGYDVIDSDEDVEAETRQYQQKLDALYNVKRREELKRGADEIQSGMDKLDIRQKREERRKRREELAKEPKNLLFSDENLWNDLSSTDDSGVTEEDDDDPRLMSPKRVKGERL